MGSKDRIADDETEQRTIEPLYPGDTGKLPADARRVLVALLAGPSIEEKRHAKLWPALLNYENTIRTRLSDLFLDMELDKELGFAFIRHADTGDLDAPIIVRQFSLTFLQSVLLLYLRRVLMEAIARGESAIVSELEITAELKLYERANNSDRAGFEKNIRSAIDRMKKNSILSLIRGSVDRYEISATLKHLVTPEEVEAFSQQYRNLRDGLVKEDALESATENTDE
jgi:hypothetical protein